MRVFVASSFEDLLAYRAAVTRSILAAGDLPEDMLYWPAEESPPLAGSLRRLRSSSLLVLLIAHRYGTPPFGQDQSITELEFDEAVARNIPILAFQVDSTYPWPPHHVETDPERRVRLENFVTKVKSKVTIKFFTSPESLEVSITRALTQFLSQGKAAPLSHYAKARSHELSRSDLLYHSPDATVKIGRAPDGALLALSVQRQIRVRNDLANIARRFRKSLDDPVFREVYSQLNQEARRFATADGVYCTDAGGLSIDAYVSSEPLTKIAAPSLFQSMLRFHSPAGGSHSGHTGRPSESEGTFRSGVTVTDGSAPGLMSLGGKNRFLCVALEADQGIWSGGFVPHGRGTFTLALWRPFIEESLERFKGVRYSIQSDAYASQPSSLIETEQSLQFTEKWVELLLSASDEHLGRMRSRIQVPRSSIVYFVLDLIDEVAELHKSGQIHGDIKPSNILASRHGASLIDEVGLHAGDVSPTVTPGWSPGEQLLREPLTCAADIFPLGQILLHVLDGEPLGREARFRLPDGEMATVFDNPAVYFGPNNSVVPERHKLEWAQLIEKALRSDPKERWPTAGEMAEAIRNLTDKGDVLGSVEVGFPWGKQPSLISEGGVPAAGYIMKSWHNASLF